MQRPQLKTGGGEFTPYVKYNAKAGRWYTKQDHENAEEEEVKNLTAVFDLENTKTAWMLFEAGAAPQKHYDTVPGVPDQRPEGDRWKHGIEFMMYSGKNLYGVREFSTTANSVLEAYLDLWDKWDAAPEKASGHLPVVQCTGTAPITGKHGTNYKPEFAIVAWANRADTPLADSASKEVASAPAPTPAPAPAPAPATAQGSPEF